MSLRMRRGGPGQAGSPNPPATYGPTDGAAAIRAGAGPRTVVDPGGGISFNSSASLQTAINNNPISSVFVCSTNAPVWNSTVSTGTKRPTIIFPGPVGQKVIDGGGAERGAISTGDGTTIKGGTFQNFGTAVNQAGLGGTGDDCVFEDVVVTDIFVNGLSTGGLNTRISYCRFHTNAWQGLQTGNSGVGQTDGMIVDHCDIYGNNTALHSPGNQGGAHKFLYTAHGWYHHNYVHDNIGFGAWWDTDNSDWLIEENVCENNNMSGLFYEANYGSVIRRNYVANNGRNQIIGATDAGYGNVANVRLSDNAASRVSPDGFVYPVDFQFNWIEHTGSFGGNTGGLLILWDHTDDANRHVSNHDIHHNQWWIRFSHAIGGSQVSRIRAVDADVIGGITTNFQIWDLDNQFFSNDYRVVNTTSPFWAWGTGTSQGADVSFSTWQGFHPTGETRNLI